MSELKTRLETTEQDIISANKTYDAAKESLKKTWKVYMEIIKEVNER